MSAKILWIDQTHAELYHLTSNGVQKEHLKRTHHEHSNSHEDARNHQELEKFFHEITAHLKDVKELLVMGPGLAKDHFKTHLDKHHHGSILKAVVGVVPMDHASEKQVFAKAREFFKSYDQFH